MLSHVRKTPTRSLRGERYADDVYRRETLSMNMERRRSAVRPHQAPGATGSTGRAGRSKAGERLAIRFPMMGSFSVIALAILGISHAGMEI